MRTEAQKRASNKYEKEKVDSILVRVPKGMKDKITKKAKDNGESVNEMINRLIEKELRKSKWKNSRSIGFSRSEWWTSFCSFRKIRNEKEKLIAEGKIKKDKNESIIYRRDNKNYMN